MRLRNPGRIGDGLWLLGSPESCVYLVQGSQSSALISAGLSYILPDLLFQLSLAGISEKQIDSIIILHAHFDHIGIVPFLKRQWPHVNLYASSRGWQILSNPKAISVNNDFTRQVCCRMRGGEEVLAGWDWSWRDDVSGISLQQGSCLDLGDRQIQVIETPGHSSCSISVYIPQIQALFPSDAAAIPYRDEYLVAAGSSFADYFRSLDKLSMLDVKMICADHFGVITGEEAQQYVSQSKSAAQQMTDHLRLALQTEGSPKRAAKRMVKLHFEQRPDYFITPEILLYTYERMMKQFASE